MLDSFFFNSSTKSFRFFSIRVLFFNLSFFFCYFLCSERLLRFCEIVHDTEAGALCDTVETSTCSNYEGNIVNSTRSKSNGQLNETKKKRNPEQTVSAYAFQLTTTTKKLQEQFFFSILYFRLVVKFVNSSRKHPHYEKAEWKKEEKKKIRFEKHFATYVCMCYVPYIWKFEAEKCEMKEK